MEPEQDVQMSQPKRADGPMCRKVFRQNDCLQYICSFMMIIDIFQVMPVLSVFFNKYFKNTDCKPLITKCIAYDFDDQYLETLNINLDFNNIKDSVSMQLQRIYTDYDYIFNKIIECTTFRNETNMSDKYIRKLKSWVDYKYNISVLFSLKKLKIIQFWLRKV